MSKLNFYAKNIYIMRRQFYINVELDCLEVKYNVLEFQEQFTKIQKF